MKKNEATAGRRVVGPIPFYDNSGNLLSGQTFSGSAGSECQIFNLDAGAFAYTSAAAAATEVPGTGMYYVQLSQADTNHASFLVLRLRKATYADHYERVPIEDVVPDDVNTAVAAVATAVSDAETAILAATDALAAELLAIGGLVHRNSMVDNCTYDGTGNLLTARVRVFADATDLAAAVAGHADDADGEIYRYTLTGTVAALKMATFKARQVL